MATNSGSVNWPVTGNPPHPPLLSGMVVPSVDQVISGQIWNASGPTGVFPGSGNITAHGIVSGLYPSGFIGGTSWPAQSGGSYYYCPHCHKPFDPMITDQVIVRGVSGLHQVWCWKCAGYRYEQGGAIRQFDGKRLEWTIEGSPFTTEVPLPILHDWLEENNKQEAADFIKGLMDGAS